MLKNTIYCTCKFCNNQTQNSQKAKHSKQTDPSVVAQLSNMKQWHCKKRTCKPSEKWNILSFNRLQYLLMFQDLSFLVKVTFYYCKALKIQNCPVNVVLRDEVGQKGQQKKKSTFKSRTTIQSFYYSFMDSLLVNLLRPGKSRADYSKKCMLNTSCGNKLKLKIFKHFQVYIGSTYQIESYRN